MGVMPVPPASMPTLAGKGYWALTLNLMCLNATLSSISMVASRWLNAPFGYALTSNSKAPTMAFVDTGV